MYSLFKRKRRGAGTTKIVAPTMTNSAKAKILSANFAGSIDCSPGEKPCFAAGVLTLRVSYLNDTDLGASKASQSCGLVHGYDVDMTKVWEGKIDLNDIKFYGQRVDYSEFRQLLIDTVAGVVRELHSDMHTVNETYLAVPINENHLDPEKIMSMCLERLTMLGYSFTQSPLSINAAPEALKMLSLFEDEKTKFQTWLNENVAVNANVGTSTKFGFGRSAQD